MLATLHHLKLDGKARVSNDKFHLTSRSLADRFPRLWPQVDHEWQTGNVGLEWSLMQWLILFDFASATSRHNWPLNGPAKSPCIFRQVRVGQIQGLRLSEDSYNDLLGRHSNLAPSAQHRDLR